MTNKFKDVKDKFSDISYNDLKNTFFKKGRHMMDDIEDIPPQHNEKLLIGFTAGAIIGAVAGLLMAPSTGTDTRNKLMTNARKLSDDIKEQAAKAMDNIERASRNATDQINKSAEDAKEKAGKASNNA